MSFIHSFARLGAGVMLVAMHVLLIWLYALSLVKQSGGPFEVGCLLIHLFAVILLAIQAAHFLWRSKFAAELPDNTADVAFSGILSVLTLLGSIVITVRATHHPGLSKDYAALSDPSNTAATVLALTWCTTVLALVALFVTFFDKWPGAVRVSAVTSKARPYSIDSQHWQDIRALPRARHTAQVAPLRHNEQYKQGPRFPEPTYSSWPDRFFPHSSKTVNHSISFDSDRFVGLGA